MRIPEPPLVKHNCCASHIPRVSFLFLFFRLLVYRCDLCDSVVAAAVAAEAAAATARGFILEIFRV